VTAPNKLAKRFPFEFEFGVATAVYHRWKEDLDLIASLGVDECRFSIM